jgi:hypothetical protein
MKLKLRGRRFESTEEIQVEPQEVLKMPTQNDFQLCFGSWKSRSDRFVNIGRDYFEGYSDK